MRYLIFGVMLLFLATPALADEPAIKVIRPDGTVDVYNIPQRSETVPPPSAAGGPTLEDMMAVTPPAPKEQPQAVAAAKPVSVKPAKKAVRKSSAPSLQKAFVQKESVPPAPRIVPPKTPAAMSVPPGQEITRELALAIALPHAPPARSVDVVNRTYKGKLVYFVQFKTDGGPRDVLVDAQSGDVVLVK